MIAQHHGLGSAWGPIQRYWKEPSSSNREALRTAFTPKEWEEPSGEWVPGTPLYTLKRPASDLRPEQVGLTLAEANRYRSFGPGAEFGSGHGCRLAAPVRNRRG